MTNYSLAHDRQSYILENDSFFKFDKPSDQFKEQKNEKEYGFPFVKKVLSLDLSERDVILNHLLCSVHRQILQKS